MLNTKTKKSNLLSLPEIDVQHNFSICFVSKAINIIFIISVLVVLLIFGIFISVDVEIITDTNKIAKLITQYFNNLF